MYGRLNLVFSKWKLIANHDIEWSRTGSGWSKLLKLLDRVGPFFGWTVRTLSKIAKCELLKTRKVKKTTHTKITYTNKRATLLLLLTSFTYTTNFSLLTLISHWSFIGLQGNLWTWRLLKWMPKQQCQSSGLFSQHSWDSLAHQKELIWSVSGWNFVNTISQDLQMARISDFNYRFKEYRRRLIYIYFKFWKFSNKKIVMHLYSRPLRE